MQRQYINLQQATLQSLLSSTLFFPPPLLLPKKRVILIGDTPCAQVLALPFCTRHQAAALKQVWVCKEL